MTARTFSARLILVLTVLSMVALFGSACGTEGPVNQIPIIASVSGEPASVGPGGTATITCVASDPDGDKLSYTWSTTGGSLSGTGKSVTFTAPDAAGTYVISVTVDDDNGGTADKSHTVTVAAETDNMPPVIEGLSTELEIVEPKKWTTVTCVANDPDGDPLTYSWWTNLGRIEGAGSNVTWTAPPWDGEYTIEVTVRDGREGVAVASYKIAVAPNELPVIKDLNAAQGMIVLEHSTTISCEAEDADGDELNYTWSTAEGSLSGTGNEVTWMAPGRAGYFTIEVTVDDGRGGTDTSSVDIQAIGTKVTITLDPVTRESGAIRTDNRVISLWTVGDDTVNNGIRTLLSFDISRIDRVEELQNATLSISTIDQNGTPWSGLGGLDIGEVEYGTRSLKAEDYELTSKRLERYTSAPTNGIDLTSIISRAVRDKASRFQIMVYFQEETDEDNTADNVKVTKAYLTVTYIGETY
ncbi:Ig-like domain-containing protein [Chloroflexota bacterium]